MEEQLEQKKHNFIEDSANKQDPIHHNFTPTKGEKVEQDIEKAAEDLNIRLPKSDIPLVIRLIGLLTLVGGLGILGSVFSDIFNPNRIGPYVYFIRLFAGVGLVVISYGILKHQRWAIWAYLFVVILGATVNPYLAILPGLIVVYLFLNRDRFEPSMLDEWAGRLIK